MSAEEQNELYGDNGSVFVFLNSSQNIFLISCSRTIAINKINICNFSDQLQKLYQEENAELVKLDVRYKTAVIDILL